MQRSYLLIVPAAAALLGACATHGVDNHYGEAWAQMQRAQTYNVRAGDDTAVLGMDQIQEMHALAALRNDVSDRTAVKPQPLVSISNNSSSGGGGGGGTGSQ
jgi:hypothetical protein